MPETPESNMNENINSAGDGSGLQLPPAFVVVKSKTQRKMKKNNADKIDGRSKGVKDLFSRISRRKMKKEEVEHLVLEAAPSETERAQEQIKKKKELDSRKDLQTKKDEANKKMARKEVEMKDLLKARMSDIKKRAGAQRKKATLKNSREHEGEVMTENKMDALEVALQVATAELDPMKGESTYAKIQFDDGKVQNLDNFSAKRIAAAYQGLSDEHKDQYRYMLNKDASTFQSALAFAVKNV